MLLFEVHGSPAFQPPEVVSGEEHSGPKTDLWAAGITLYYMLTGQTPFNGQRLPPSVHPVASRHPVLNLCGYCACDAAHKP